MIRVWQDTGAVSPSTTASRSWKNWAALGLFALLWADLIRELGYHWNADEQYAYGWFVPFLAFGLFWKRWWTKPEPVTPATIKPQPLWLPGMALLLALLLLPVRVVYEINPDWPLPQLLMTSLVVALSLYAVFLTGGINWVRHFAFPISFIFVAVQWPYRIEHGLTQALMRTVANATVELLGWFDIPAVQHGNLIEVNSGMVGVEEACSGIRSFQSTLMAGLFLGELYLLAWPRRCLLVLIGVVVSFAFNVCRTLFLTWKASTDGLDAIEKWHDAAGLSIFFASFACLWLLSIALKGRNRAEFVGPAQCNPVSFVVPRWFLASVGCWSVVVFGLDQFWYHAHDFKGPEGFRWSVALPENAPTFKKIELMPRSLHLLAFDKGVMGEWQNADGVDWTGYFFRWEPRSIESVIHSRIHRPDVCLPAAGLREISDGGLKNFDVANMKLPFRRYVYESGGKSLCVFFCQWEDGAEHQIGMLGSNGAERIKSAWIGRRYLGQQTLELILTGCGSLEQADQAVCKSLPDLVKIEETPKHLVDKAN